MSASRAGRLDVGVIGMGHVGPVIGSALRAAGHTISAVTASSEASLERANAMLPGVPVRDADEVARGADLVVLAVPDDRITPLVEGLARLGVWRPGHLVLHLSGAHGIGALEAAARAGAVTMAVHPAMTFTGTSVDVPRLVGTPFAVTAPAPFLPIAQALVVEMGGEPVIIEEEARPLYHAALAHAANLPVAILAQAQEALRLAGVEDPGAFMRPLCEAALDRALREGPHAVSGPVRRGDAGTVRTHVRVLSEAARQARVLDSLDPDLHARGTDAGGPGALGGEGDETGAARRSTAPGLGDIASTYREVSAATVTLLEEAGLLAPDAARAVRDALADPGAGT